MAECACRNEHRTKEIAMNKNIPNDLDLGHDLVLNKPERRESVPGRWVTGCLNGHYFEALVFEEHAEDPGYEIGDSRISKLYIRRQSDKQEVFNWDRGQDIPAADDTTKAIVDFLAAGLAEAVYGN